MTTNETPPWSFDWHAERGNHGRESFLYWMVITVLSGMRDENPDIFDRVAAATNKLADVRITMQINGIEVDARGFIDLVEQNMRHQATVEARRLLDELIDFGGLSEMVNDLQRSVQSELRHRLAGMGMELPEVDD
jgi:hypothetical protein